MPTLELDRKDAGILAEVLSDYVSDLRMEVANTDSMDVRNELKERELILKEILRKLGAEESPLR